VGAVRWFPLLQSEERSMPTATPPFIPGIELNRAFYQEAVRPILAAHFPGLAYSAALIGSGSDVLGCDTAQSTDHEWGPRLLLFLSDTDYPACATEIDEALSRNLPPTFHGYSTGFSDRDVEGVRVMCEAIPGAVRHHVDIHTIRSFVRRVLDRDPDEPLRAADWLVLPQQRLLDITAGAVYCDGLGTLLPLRERLAYYPHDIWLYLLAAQWMRISQEEAFMGRCGDVGDELGSRLIAARLVHDVMGLSFLMQRRYAPYSKWFGTAFARLPCAAELAPTLHDALQTSSWRERERRLSTAYMAVARMHNALDITPPLDADVSPYYSRPYLTLYARRFAEALLAAITDDEEVRQIMASVGPIGAIDQFADSVDLLARPALCSRAQALYA
jgi:hypothetical protein